MPVEISGAHIAAAGGGFEPQRKNNFLLYLNPPAAMTGAADFSRIIRLSLQSFPFPKENTEATPIRYINTERKVPGFTTYPELALVVKDFVDQETANLLLRWKRRVFDPVTGATGRAVNIKGVGQVWLFPPDGDEGLLRKWKLWGVWPGNVDLGDGDMTLADINLITAILHVDYWEPLSLSRTTAGSAA